MGFTAGFVAALAQDLEDAGIGVWRPDATSYGPGETAIFDSLVPASPDRLITLTLYLPDDDATQAEGSYWVQARTRGGRDVRVSSDLQDAVFDRWHNAPRRTLGDYQLAGSWRRSGGYIGADGNGRHAHTGNYEFRLHRPSPHRS